MSTIVCKFRFCADPELAEDGPLGGYFGYGRAVVAEDDAGGLDAKLPADVRRVVVPELVWVPVVRPSLPSPPSARRASW